MFCELYSFYCICIYSKIFSYRTIAPHAKQLIAACEQLIAACVILYRYVLEVIKIIVTCFLEQNR